MVSEPQIGPQASGRESSREQGGPGKREEAPAKDTVLQEWVGGWRFGGKWAW